MIGEEPRLAYNRVLLSSVLAGDTTSDEIALQAEQWWRDRGVTLQYGCAAPRSTDRAHLTLADGRIGFGNS